MPPGRTSRFGATPDAVAHPASKPRAVGLISMTMCSPASRRVASLRPRFAGLTALTPAARTIPGEPAGQPGNAQTGRAQNPMC